MNILSVFKELEIIKNELSLTAQNVHVVCDVYTVGSGLDVVSSYANDWMSAKRRLINRMCDSRLVIYADSDSRVHLTKLGSKIGRCFFDDNYSTKDFLLKTLGTTSSI